MSDAASPSVVVTYQSFREVDPGISKRENLAFDLKTHPRLAGWSRKDLVRSLLILLVGFLVLSAFPLIRLREYVDGNVHFLPPDALGNNAQTQMTIRRYDRLGNVSENRIDARGLPFRAVAAQTTDDGTPIYTVQRVFQAEIHLEHAVILAFPVLLIVFFLMTIAIIQNKARINRLISDGVLLRAPIKRMEFKTRDTIEKKTGKIQSKEFIAEVEFEIHAPDGQVVQNRQTFTKAITGDINPYRQFDPVQMLNVNLSNPWLAVLYLSKENYQVL